MDPSPASCPVPIERPPPVLSPPKPTSEPVPRTTPSTVARTEPVAPSSKATITQSKSSGISSQVGTVSRPLSAPFIPAAQHTVSVPSAASSTLLSAPVLSHSAGPLGRLDNAAPYIPRSHLNTVMGTNDTVSASTNTSTNIGAIGTNMPVSSASSLGRLANAAPYIPRSYLNAEMGTNDTVSASASTSSSAIGKSMLGSSTSSLGRLVNAAPYIPRSYLDAEMGTNDTVSASTSANTGTIGTTKPASSTSSLGRLANAAPYIPRSFLDAEMGTNGTIGASTSANTGTIGISKPASLASPSSTALSGALEGPIFKFIPAKLDESHKLTIGPTSSIDREFERWRTSRPSSELPLTSISGSASDEFPHLDIIDDLLHEDMSRGKSVSETHEYHPSNRY